MQPAKNLMVSIFPHDYLVFKLVAIFSRFSDALPLRYPSLIDKIVTGCIKNCFRSYTVIYVIATVFAGTQGATCALAGSRLRRPRGAVSGVGAGRGPFTDGRAIGGSRQPERPTIVLHTAGS